MAGKPLGQQKFEKTIFDHFMYFIYKISI